MNSQLEVVEVHGEIPDLSGKFPRKPSTRQRHARDDGSSAGASPESEGELEDDEGRLLLVHVA